MWAVQLASWDSNAHRQLIDVQNGGDLCVRRYYPLLRRFVARLLGAGMAKKAVMGAVMHKLAHLIYGLVQTDKRFDINQLSKGHAICDGI